MQSQINRRGYEGHVFENRHLKLNDLKEEAKYIENRYLSINYIPEHPRPEFHTTYLKHDTDRKGLRGISEDNGFKSPEGNLVWWSLVVGPNEITSAEKRLIETTFPDRTEEQAQMQQSFLGKFATSPAFMESSRLGSYRFTFPLEEVLKAYSDQFCSGEKPIMRILETVLYKAEVMYAVLVHSPDNDEMLSNHPLLTDDPNSICSYRDGCFIWRPESMCNTLRHRLIKISNEKRMTVEEVELYLKYYIWDNVSVVLHVDQQVLEFDENRLRENLKFCKKGFPKIAHDDSFDKFPKAEVEVKKLWPNYPSPLKRSGELDEEPAGI